MVDDPLVKPTFWRTNHPCVACLHLIETAQTNGHQLRCFACMQASTAIGCITDHSSGYIVHCTVICPAMACTESIRVWEMRGAPNRVEGQAYNKRLHGSTTWLQLASFLAMVTQGHCLLNVTIASILCRYLQCTGGLLDSGHILTAAHCVWNIEATSSADRTYVSTLNFYPGMNGGSLSANALGVYTWHSVKVLSEFTDQTVRSFHSTGT